MRAVIRQQRTEAKMGEQMENKELKIKVIGIGGAGNNIVNSMNENKLDGVELYVANTDRQVLEKADVQNRIYLGDNYNGAGGDPENGRIAAEKTYANRPQRRTLPVNQRRISI